SSPGEFACGRSGTAVAFFCPLRPPFIGTPRGDRGGLWMTRRLLGCCCLFLVFALRTHAANGDADDRLTLSLTAAEEKDVLQLTDAALKEKKLLQGKIVLARIDVYNDNKGKKAQRLAIVLQYRYEGNLTILTTVDVKEKKVLKVETDPDFPLPLTREELEVAIKLARAFPEVKKQLAKHVGTIEAEGLLTTTIDEKSPEYHHRVVQVVFKRNGTYLDAPRVHVDLTTETVQVVSSAGDHLCPVTTGG